MADHNTDEAFLQRALELARQGIGLVSPNPCVGAVIVDSDGTIIGSGFHTYDGLKHAEVLALEQASDKARGATLYLNLEPCSHHGRTPPCADAIISAGLRRVVACMEDPNPQVSGRGFTRLRDAGIAVTSGLLQAEAQSLNEAFATYIRHRRPLVTLKSAMTLDGKIAPPLSDSRHSEPITGELARGHVQQLRHQNDAILVGIGTALADDPLLTDRGGRPRRRPMLRVVLDSRLRLPLESRLVKTAQDDLLVLCSFPDEEKKRQLERRGVQVEQIIPTRDRHPDLVAVLRNLGERQITSLLIEGGSQVNASALTEGIVDKVFFYYAPRIFAGANSVPFIAGGGMNHAAHVSQIRLHSFGENFAIEGYLRDPYET